MKYSRVETSSIAELLKVVVVEKAFGVEATVAAIEVKVRIPKLAMVIIYFGCCDE